MKTERLSCNLCKLKMIAAGFAVVTAAVLASGCKEQNKNIQNIHNSTAETPAAEVGADNADRGSAGRGAADNNENTDRQYTVSDNKQINEENEHGVQSDNVEADLSMSENIISGEGTSVSGRGDLSEEKQEPGKDLPPADTGDGGTAWKNDGNVSGEIQNLQTGQGFGDDENSQIPDTEDNQIPDTDDSQIPEERILYDCALDYQTVWETYDKFLAGEITAGQAEQKIWALSDTSGYCRWSDGLEEYRTCRVVKCEFRIETIQEGEIPGRHIAYYDDYIGVRNNCDMEVFDNGDGTITVYSYSYIAEPV